jgi:hypothetical protein
MKMRRDSILGLTTGENTNKQADADSREKDATHKLDMAASARPLLSPKSERVDLIAKQLMKLRRDEYLGYKPTYVEKEPEMNSIEKNRLSSMVMAWLKDRDHINLYTYVRLIDLF